MRPETISEMVISILFAAIGIFTAMCLKMEWVNPTVALSIVSASSGIISIIFGIRHFLRSKPFNKYFSPLAWNAHSHINSHKDVFITISREEHKKGTSPKIKIQGIRGNQADLLLDYEISKQGDILIFHRRNSFMPPWKEFSVRITS